MPEASPVAPRAGQPRAPGGPDIPGYIIERQLGRGGSATVYLARERKHDRLVAVKVLHAALTASMQAERFLREIEIIAQLAHPNILPLLDSGKAGGVLYYVTPYVPGESVRGRLEREHTLPVEDAVRIVSETAAALDYAHRQGVVHRDVKPENILLADGHALVADFGIARALSVAIDDRLTTPGFALGTPHYMSPEQWSGRAEIDGRSDVYSLGCVLFELLAGAAPFVAETPQEIAAMHLSATRPSLRAVVTTVPRGIDAAVARAMAKLPAQRFATAAEFAQALAAAGTWSTAKHRMLDVARQHPARLLLLLAGAGLAVLTVRWAGGADGAAGWLSSFVGRRGADAPALDTSVYLVLPPDSAGAGTVLDLAGLLAQGFKQWRDVVAEPAPVSGRASGGARNASPAAPAALATSLGAGRYVQLRARRDGDSLEIAASLYDTRRAAPLVRRSVRAADSEQSLRPAMSRLADSLLFRAPVARDHVDDPPGTTSLQARQAYLRGQFALANGDFRLADSAFLAARYHDPEYAQALLWLANVRSWVNRSDLPWTQLVSQAAPGRSRLAPADTPLLDALVAQSGSDPGAACPLWRGLTRSRPADFAMWYALGNCLRRDAAVVRGRGPGTGWQFRSSAQEAVTAFERAFNLRPSVLRGFGGQSLAELQSLLYTSGARLRPGRSVPPDTLQFSGYPIWQGDTLAFVPLLTQQTFLTRFSAAMGEAVQHERLRFRNVATLWRAEFPGSPDAAEAMAVAMEMLGDEAALDSLKRARSLAVDAGDQLRIAATEVWVRVKVSLPTNQTGLRAARLLADSILDANPVGRGGDSRALGSLAALTGRANLASAYARTEAGNQDLPAIARTGPALLAFAALGGPHDSLAALEQRVESALPDLSAADAATARRDWLVRAGTLAFPDYRFGLFGRTGTTGLPLGDLVAAAMVNDTQGVRARSAAVAEARRWLRPSDVMTDGLFPEAAALTQVGDAATAIARLDQTLRAIRFTASRDLAYNTRAGPLVRAMILRADLARRAGDAETARLWAIAVIELWSGADSFLQPAVQRMKSLAP